MLNLVKGHQVSLVENLFESFTKLTEHHLMANVHAEKILEVFQHFIAIHDEPLFFILELPVSVDREKVIAKNIIKESHKDVYYIDGCSREYQNSSRRSLPSMVREKYLRSGPPGEGLISPTMTPCFSSF